MLGVTPSIAACRRVEHGVELARDGAALRTKPIIECVDARTIHRFRNECSLALVDRNDLGLPIVAILQPMLEHAQERVAIVKYAGCVRRDRTALRERAQRVERTGDAQCGLTSAAHDLQRLHYEFDLANAS